MELDLSAFFIFDMERTAHIKSKYLIYNISYLLRKASGCVKTKTKLSGKVEYFFVDIESLEVYLCVKR